MKGSWTLALCVGLSLGAACGPEPVDTPMLKQLESCISAMEARDWARVWKLTAPGARSEVLAIHGRLQRALDTVPHVYGVHERERASAAVGRDLLAGLAPGSADLGPRLLERMLRPEAMRFDQRARDGLLSAEPTIDGNRASLLTAAGETFTFERQGDGVDPEALWRSRVVMDILESSDAMARLLDNANEIGDAHKRARAAWSASTDTRQPQGAYNRLRMAVSAKPVDVPTIHQLLDRDSVEALLDSLKISRKAQRVVQRRTKMAERRAAYRDRGLTPYVMTRTDLALYKGWAKSPTWKPPVQRELRPVSASRRSGPEEDIADLKLDNGGSVAMRLGTDGHWRLTGHGGEIRAALHLPMEKLLSKLTR